ncbi:MAG: glycosyltransferase family 4 protein [Caulobacteraceae bacterium]
MFVLQIATTKGRGGIVTAMSHYARMFKASGVRHAAIYRGPATEALRAEGIDLVDAPPLNSPFAPLLSRMGGLLPEIRTRAGGEPMLALVHSDLSLSAVRQLWPAAVAAAPCHSDKFKRKREADLVITLNPVQQERAASALAGSRARPVLLGNPYVPTPAEESLLRLAAAPRLVFCGRFIETKDPMILLKAAAQMRPAPSLCFIGAGPLEAELRQAASVSTLDVTFPGWLSQPFESFTERDILVSPSSWEGLPYMVQEALSRGVSVIAADNAGNRFALGDGAYGALFPPGDAGALARQMEAALADPDDLRARAAQGRLAVGARYGAAPFWRALSDAVSPLMEAGRVHV